MICLSVEQVTTNTFKKNLEAVFERLQKFGLRIKLAKCLFMAPLVVYFGLRFSDQGLQPTDEKVQTIKVAPTPRNVSELHAFLGKLAALSTFIPKLSTVARPLYVLFGNRPWTWSPSCNQVSIDVKKVLTSDTVRAHYNPSLLVELWSNAPQYGLGNVIMHVYPNGKRRPIAYASRTLDEHEKRYGQINKEALAIMFGFKRFHLYLYVRQFTVVADHKPPERIFGPKTAIPSSAAMRLQRWATDSFGLQLQYQICPVKSECCG